MKFKICLGDFCNSRDRSRYYTIKANCNDINIVTKVYTEKLVKIIDFGSFCDSYEDNIVPSNIAKKIEELTNRSMINITKNDYKYDNHASGSVSISAEGMIKIFIACMNTIEPSLELEESNDELPIFNSYRNNYNIGDIGYGLV